MSAPARWEYLRAIHVRYRQAARWEKGPILDELYTNTGYRREYGVPRRIAGGGGSRTPQGLGARLPAPSPQEGDEGVGASPGTKRSSR
jgi:hypothetical protein